MIKQILCAGISFALSLSMALSAGAAVVNSVKTEVPFDSVERMVLSNNKLVLANNATINSLKQTLADLDKGSSSNSGQSIEDLIKELTTNTKTIGIRIAAIKTGLANNPSNKDELESELKSLEYLLPLYTSALASLTSSQAMLSSQSTDKEGTKRTLQASILQLEQANYQLAYAAQSMYLGYLTLQRSIEDVNQSRMMMARNLEIMQTQFDTGKITKAELSDTQVSLEAIDKNLDSLSIQLENLSLDLGLAIGLGTGVSPVLLNFKSSIENFAAVHDNYGQAIKNSYDIRIKALEFDGSNQNKDTAIKQYKSDSALFSLAYQQESVRIYFLKLCNSVHDKQNKADMTKKQMEAKQLLLANATAKFEAGVANRTDFLTAQTNERKAYLAYQTALSDIYADMLKYNWALRGVIIKG